MSEATKFILDGKEVEALPGETIWRAATRLGAEIPHLCYRHTTDYKGDGNCRACVVEVEGERTLAPSCICMPTPGMKVNIASDRAVQARKMVFELLLADQKEPDGSFKNWLDRMEIRDSRFPARETVGRDSSHTSIEVNLDKCIHCQLCVQACRDIQGNDVIGMAHRGNLSSIVFDMEDPMGTSSCVACGECVQVCPTGALLPANHGRGDYDGVPDKKVDSVCPYCGVGCQVTLHVKDNKIVTVEGRDGPSNHNRLCVKGRFGLDYASHPERLTVPMIRKDGVAKDPHALVDPANPWDVFRPASWDEALAKASEGFTKIIAKHGGGALSGFGSAKGSNEEAYMFQKLVRTGFHTNNVDHCTRLCHASSVAALFEGIGTAAVTAPVISCLHSDVIVIIGANPTVNHPVAATFIKNAVEQNGAELIVIDPRKNALQNYATHFLQFKPSSDVALLNAFLNVIIAEKLYDRQFVEARTEGFAEYADHLGSFTPERMAPLCGVGPDEIRKVARKIARAKAAMIFWGMGISQSTHGTDNARCLIALALLCGHVGRPGAGLHPLRGQNNVQGASDAGLIPMMYPDYKVVTVPETRKFYEDFWGTALDPNKGLTVVEIIHAILRDEVRGMYVMGENPAMSDPDTEHTREALAKLEHLVVQDIFLTETAAFADVILPASAWPEKDGSVTNTDRRVQLGRKALEMPGEARQDWWIIQEIARRLGLDWNYGGPADVHEEMRDCMPSMKNISWERLQREGIVTYPVADEIQLGQDIIFPDKFPTPSGLGRLVPTDVLPPDEVPDAAYPLVLTTGRLLEHWHTGAMTRRAHDLDNLEPDPIVSVSPGDMDRMGLQPGDMVAVSTRRGSIELSARRDSNVPDGLIFIPFCYVEAAANFLTNPALDPYGKIAELKFCAAKLEKVARLAAE